MKGFALCPPCQAEYDQPQNRRFHAQPNACPACGPTLELWNPAGEIIARSQHALVGTADAIRGGQIVAVKGIGGFHLLVAAQANHVVQLLRQRKDREEKPFALLFPNIETIKAGCDVSPLEERLLRSPEAPIVLLKRLKHCAGNVADSVAPGNPNLGVMLPANPLHHLLMAALGFPVIATSANLSDEPICIDEHEALLRLRGIADWFLVHNRPIVRQVDDSIVRIMLGREMVLRRARGFAPLPIRMPSTRSSAGNILAVGAQQKNSIALAVENQVFLSQHIGDLATEAAYTAFRRVIMDFENLYEVKPAVIVCDRHPDYLSTRYAETCAGKKLEVQHRIAHALSCMADNEITPPVLGVTWDGTGYGLDGTIWGGEFFLITENDMQRVGHFRTFRLPGGELAVREPRRIAAGLLYELLGEELFTRKNLPWLASFSDQELSVIKVMLSRKINSPVCSSAGRLFDAVAALINLRQQTRFEGQAALELEFALEGIQTEDHYDVVFAPGSGPLIIDWAPMIEGILAEVAQAVPSGHISAKFHNTLAEAIVAVARRIGQQRVVLAGGCFQNCHLIERTVKRLRDDNFQPYWHQRVPPNDGGIALGQIMAARRTNG
jgi:hydrogenase maturation protein HypF